MDRTISSENSLATKTPNEMHALSLQLAISQEVTKFLQNIGQTEPYVIRDYNKFSEILQKMEQSIKVEIRKYFEVER